MKISKTLSALVAVALSLGTFAHAAHATAYVENFTLATTPDIQELTNTPSFSLNLRAWNLGGLFTPFNLVSGDTIQANISFTSPLSITDDNPGFASGNLQNADISFSDGLRTSGFTFSESTAVSFTGVTGDFLGDPAPLTATGNAIVESVAGTTGYRNLTDSTMSVTGVSFLIDVLSIPAQGAPFSFGSFTMEDDANPVPAPASLASLGFGLIGIGGMRKKVKAA